MNKQNRQEDPLEPGKFYILNNQFDEAEKFFTKYLEVDSNNPNVYYNLGLVYEAKNELEKAKQMYEKVLSISPSHKLAKKHLDKLIGI